MRVVRRPILGASVIAIDKRMQVRQTVLEGESADDILIHALVQMTEDVTEGDAGGVHTDTTFTAGGGVEEGTLNREGGTLQHFFESELESDDEVRVTDRQHHQVLIGEEEVAMIGRDSHAGGHTHTEDSLEASLARKHVVDITKESFGHGSFNMEGRIVEELTAGGLNESGKSGHIGVLSGAQEDIDGHLLLHHQLGNLGV